MEFYDFSIQFGIIIPTDFHIFFKRGWNHQPDYHFIQTYLTKQSGELDQRTPVDFSDKFVDASTEGIQASFFPERNNRHAEFSKKNGLE